MIYKKAYCKIYGKPFFMRSFIHSFNIYGSIDPSHIPYPLNPQRHRHTNFIPFILYICLIIILSFSCLLFHIYIYIYIQRINADIFKTILQAYKILHNHSIFIKYVNTKRLGFTYLKFLNRSLLIN